MQDDHPLAFLSKSLGPKHQADKGRTERSFEVGDKVFLKVQPYLQSSVAYRANHKMAFKFYGPFEIEQKVGTVAYKLKLPPDSMVHPVFHVSQLKKFVQADRVISDQLPDDPPEFQLPEHILARRSRVLGSSTIKEVLVRWTGMSDASATWENVQELRQRFPDAPAWGQAGSQGEGDVTNPPTNKARAQRDKKKPGDSASAEEELQQPSKRVRTKSSRYSGPAWTA